MLPWDHVEVDLQGCGLVDLGAGSVVAEDQPEKRGLVDLQQRVVMGEPRAQYQTGSCSGGA